MESILNNRYEIIEKIGEGGMAMVYKAKDTLLNRFVAIKILKEEFSNNKEFLDNFKREATAAASLSDINIVNIYDIGSQGNTNYIVMEYVKGSTLKEIIKKNGILGVDEGIKIAIGIGKAIESAHSHNIIHRDIKPHNIMINENGVVKVTDFGIAKASTEYTITNSKEVLGSAHYFSPEQARGSFVDFRTDIYSFGIVMYEMFTGVLPFDGESPIAIALKHLQEKMVEPKFLNDNISEGVNNIILKSTEKDPANRYSSIKEIIRDLKKLNLNPDYQISYEKSDIEMTRVMEPVNPISKKSSKNKKKKVAIIGASLVVLLIILFFSAKYIFYSNKNTYINVPKTIGMDKEAAKREIEKAGLVFSLESDVESELALGLVAKTSPEAGSATSKGGVIKVFLSSGKTSGVVPDVKNLYIESAKEILANYGFKVGESTFEFSSTVPENNVISQSVEPKTKSPKDIPINLVVSKGQEVTLIKVPLLIGKTLTEAKATIEALGFILGNGETIITSDKKKDNIVSSQDIPENTEVAKGQTIKVSVYKYEKPDFTVLNFVNKSFGNIKNEELKNMTDQGFTFIYLNKNGNKLNYKDIPDIALVTKQSPNDGTKLKQSVEITLTFDIE